MYAPSMKRRNFLALMAAAIFTVTVRVTNAGQMVLSTAQHPREFIMKVIHYTVGFDRPVSPGEDQTKVCFSLGHGVRHDRTENAPRIADFSADHWYTDLVVDGHVGYADREALSECFTEAERRYEMVH